MAGYIGSKASVVSSGAERKKTFDITASTTSLTGLSYTVGQVHVFHNGVRLVDGTDYTATNSTSITLTAAAENGDQVVVVSYASFQTSDTVSASAGGTFAGNVAFGANATFGDNDKAVFGAGSDLQIYHDGSNSYIKDAGAGQLILQGAAQVKLQSAATGDDMIKANSGSDVILYHNNAAKLATTSTGISVTGTVTATTLQTTAGGTVTTASGNDLNIVYPAGRSLFIKEGSETHVSVDNVGNVGIGTSSPSTFNSTGGKLAVASGAGNVAALFSDATYYTLGIKHTGVGSEAVGMFGGTSGSGLALMTNNTERMRITSGGALALANTGLPTNGTAGVTLAPAGNVHCGVDTTANSNVMRFDNPNGRVGSISTTNSSTSYGTSSDYRLKTDAQPMTGASARVQALNPVNFEWIVDGTRTDGFLAHEAQAVVPESVTGTKDAMRDEEYEVTAAVYEDVVIEAVLDDEGNELEAERTEQNLVTEAVMGTRNVPDYQGIDQSKLVPLLTAALQEALNKIDTMETRLAALEGN